MEGFRRRRHLVCSILVASMTGSRALGNILLIDSEGNLKEEGEDSHVLLLQTRRLYSGKTEPGEEGRHSLLHDRSLLDDDVVDFLEAENRVTLCLLGGERRRLTRKMAMAKPMSQPTQMSLQWFL